MSISMTPVLVLIVCKTLAGAPLDEVGQSNSKFTGHENLEWATEHSMMVCRRQEVQLYDPVEDQIDPKDRPVPLVPNFFDWGQCARAGIRLGTDWDAAHRNQPWRVWKVGCPAPILDRNTGKLVGYKLPECGHKDTVICEVDSEI